MKSLRCISCGKGIGKIRGACVNCYQKMLAAVRKGETTWEELISQGRCKEKQPRASIRFTMTPPRPMSE